MSVDGTSLHHEARAAGMVYKSRCAATCTVDWPPSKSATVDESTAASAELAGVDRRIDHRRLTAFHPASASGRRDHLTVVDGDRLSAARLSAAQKATRPANPRSTGRGPTAR